MGKSIEERIETLLDRLDNSTLTGAEIELIQKKIEFLNSLNK